MIELLILTAISMFCFLLGQYLSLEEQYDDQLSKMEKISNLLVFPCITIYWNLLFIYPVTITMILSLAQKLIERLEHVPEKEVDIWINDILTLFNSFEPKLSQFCLVVMPIL